MTNHSLGKTKFRSYVKADTSGGHLRLLPAYRRRLYLSSFFTSQYSHGQIWAERMADSDPGARFRMAGM
jgi:hypothetical protein